MEYYRPAVGTVVQSTEHGGHNLHMYMEYMVINMVFHTQHHEGVHIYMHDTNNADGVEEEEIPRDTVVFVCRLRSSCSMVVFFTSPSIYRIAFSTIHIIIT